MEIYEQEENKMTFAVLGNTKGKVRSWYLPRDYCFCLVAKNGRAVTKIVKNITVKHVAGLPVNLINGEIVGVYKPVTRNGIT